MDELNRNNHPNPGAPWSPYGAYHYAPPPKITFPTGKGELLFGALTLLFSLLLANCLLFAGTNLGFALGAVGLILCTAGYLRARGHRFDWYTGALLGLSVIIAAAFPRSDDGSMKFLMMLAILLSVNLAYSIQAGQNRWSSAGVTSLLDSFRTCFELSLGRMGEAGRGLGQAFRSTGTAGKKGGAVGLGLLIAVPVVGILVPLLMSADAAFEGLLALLPQLQLEEILVTAVVGVCLGWLLYTQGVALHHSARGTTTARPLKGLNPLTVNTVLLAVAMVYVAYLVSQLAYFVGGFSGILPEEFTLAEYARRGFFEMGWLCAINLGIIALAVGLVDQKPLLTRLICLFIGLVTVFLVATASAKMLLYIGSYGLTRLRVLTEVFMLWLVASTVFVCVWLFRPKLPYLKLAMVLGLALCAVLMWADVDTQVARYNVRAYQSGKLDTVDVWYLSDLNAGAVPYIEELARDADPEIAETAHWALTSAWYDDSYDLRGWNYAHAQAVEITGKYIESEED